MHEAQRGLSVIDDGLTVLREAAALAAKELKVAPSATALTTMGLRAALEAAVMRAALNDHYAQYPEARPDLADIAWAEARAFPS